VTDAAPRLTIGVFCHNHAAFIEECLASIDIKDAVEVVITDDGSRDSTREVIEAAVPSLVLRGYRVQTNLDPENRGFVARLNSFLSSMSGDRFILLSGDDRFAPGGIGRLMTAADENPTADIVFSRFGRCDQFGADIDNAGAQKRYEDLGRRYLRPGNPLLDLMSSGSFVAGGCTLVNSVFVREHGLLFNTMLANAEDYDFWLQCSSAGARFVYVAERCWDHRVLPTSKYYSAGPERLRSELTAIGRHRPGAPAAVRLGGLVWGLQIWKGQCVRGPKGERVGAREVAGLLHTNVASVFASVPLVAAQSVARRIRGWR